MRFWDSSAVLSLIFEEDGFEELSALSSEDELDESGEDGVRSILVRLAAKWTKISPTDDMRLLASIISKDHPLKTADSFQLAASLRWCEGEMEGRRFICLDRTLRRAASVEGFDVLPEAA